MESHSIIGAFWELEGKKLSYHSFVTVNFNQWAKNKTSDKGGRKIKRHQVLTIS